jgi:hypothetical protein
MNLFRAIILSGLALASPAVAQGQYAYSYFPTTMAPPAREAPPSQVLEEPLPRREAPELLPPVTSQPQVAPPRPWQPNPVAPPSAWSLPPAPVEGQSLSPYESDAGWLEDPTRIRWVGSLSGLVLGRGGLQGQVFGFQSGAPTVALTSDDTQPNWQGGGETTIGAWRGNSGVEAIFFSVAPLTASASLRDVNNRLDSSFDFSGVTLGGASAATFFDGARGERLFRKDHIHNGEFNFVHHVATPPSGASVDLLAGFRYFNFNDGLSFGSVKGSSEFGSSSGANEAYFDVRANNNLYGGQIGARAAFRPAAHWGLFLAPKLGLFDNSTSFRQHLYRGDGVDAFDLRATQQHLAMLGQIDAGTDYRVGDCLRLFIGYRVLGISGVALADHQYPATVQAVLAASSLNFNGNLLLHGGLAGFELRH